MIEIKRTIYQDFPFSGLGHIKSRRKDSRQRFERIAKLVNVKDKIILDIGTCEGAIALGLKEQGARMVFGIDGNKKSIDVANNVANFLNYDVNFKQKFITLENVKKYIYYDIIVWLSQWQWSVKQEGLEHGKQLLFEVSKKADILVFESASTDGSGGIEGTTQDDIEKWLFENTVYNKIVRHPAEGNWKGGIRDLFICSQPFIKETTKSYISGKKVIVERIDRDKIKKTWLKGIEYVKKREVKALKRLAKYSHYPKLLEEGENYIIESYCGRQSEIKLSMLKQVKEIVKELKTEKITHQDLACKNLLALSGVLYVIDFSRAIFDDEISKKHWRPRDIKGIPYTDEEALMGQFKLNSVAKTVSQGCRLVIERHLKRFLSLDESVHHINDSEDDSLENLYLFDTIKNHTRYHAKLKRGKIEPITKSNLI